MNLSFSSLSQYYLVDVRFSHRGRRRSKRRDRYLGTDGASAAWFIVEDEETLLGLAFERVAGEDARD